MTDLHGSQSRPARPPAGNPSADPALTAGDWAVLGVVAEGPTHGFAIAALLAADGSLGQVWTLPRPMVYQSIKRLDSAGMIVPATKERSRHGPTRTIVDVTPAGRQALDDWLALPVAHVRELRSLLLLKLALLDRAGHDFGPLLEGQRRTLAPGLVALEAARDESAGFERVLASWRLASYRAACDFLEEVLADRRQSARG